MSNRNSNEHDLSLNRRAPEISISMVDDSDSELEDYNLSETIFTKEELERLRRRFKKIDTDSSGCIEKDEFLSIPGVKDNPLAMRIMDVLDVDGNGLISFDEFINGLSIFLSTSKKQKDSATKHGKLMFAFKIFDIDNDGYISNGELFLVLKMMIGDNLSDENLQDLVDRAIMDADIQNDKMISFAEFISAIKTTEVEKSLTLDFNI
ncbi:hypothetical protein QEN19_002449 [Hanseniaspora menglaensis]